MLCGLIFCNVVTGVEQGSSSEMKHQCTVGQNVAARCGVLDWLFHP